MSARPASRHRAIRREARDLAQSVDAGVGPPGDRQPRRLSEHLRERVLELALDGALARLDRPAAEAAAVVLDIESVGSPLGDLPRPARDRPFRWSPSARAELDDPRVAAGALGVARGDLIDQLVDDELVLTERARSSRRECRSPRFASVIIFSTSGLTALAFAWLVWMRSCSISCCTVLHSDCDGPNPAQLV